jgi:hypothetical protein
VTVVCVCVYVCMYVCMHVYMYVCMYVLCVMRICKLYIIRLTIRISVLNRN